MRLKVGDFIVFKKWKSSTHPSPRAKETYPAEKGDMYSYRIDKIWKVVEVVDQETIEIQTRRGKRHQVRVDPTYIRKAGLLDRLLNRDRFF